MAFKVGDRVVPKAGHETFSAGNVVGFLADWQDYPKVLFDVAPVVQYSMGENPTIVLGEWFELEDSFAPVAPASDGTLGDRLLSTALREAKDGS